MDTKQIITLLEGLGLTALPSEDEVTEALKAAGVIIPAAEPVAPVNGLASLVGLGLIDTFQGERTPGNWRGSYTVEGAVCPSVNVVAPDCDPAEGETFDDGIPLYTSVDARPVFVESTLKCSTFGAPLDEAEWQRRTSKVLDLCQWTGLAHELWTGEKSEAAGYGNKFLASPDAIDVITNAPADEEIEVMSLTFAVGELEDHLSKCSCGAVHVIHCEPRVVAHLAKVGQIDRVGGRIFTKRGTQINDDAGNPGTGPATTPDASPVSTYMYGTGVLTGAIDTETRYLSLGGVGSMVTMSTNDIRYQARRAAMITWLCCHYVARVDLTA